MVKCYYRCNYYCYAHTCQNTLGNVRTFQRGVLVSVVGVATHGLEGLGIESLWGREIPLSSRPALGPTQLPVQWVPCLFPGDKAAGAWR